MHVDHKAKSQLGFLRQGILYKYILTSLITIVYVKKALIARYKLNFKYYLLLTCMTCFLPSKRVIKEYVGVLVLNQGRRRATKGGLHKLITGGEGSFWKV